MKIASTQKNIAPVSTEVVADAQVNQKNLSKMNKNQIWLDQQLIQAGVKSIDDVFYAESQLDKHFM